VIIAKTGAPVNTIRPQPAIPHFGLGGPGSRSGPRISEPRRTPQKATAQNSYDQNAGSRLLASIEGGRMGRVPVK